MGEVAVDIFEMLRNNRHFMKEQAYRALNVIKEDDDVGEVLFKLNEQMLGMNKNMESLVNLQVNKRRQVW